jgi:hypothetical protein
MILITILVGITIIILGRKSLWLGVFSASFVFASQTLTYFLFDQPQTTIWIISGVISGIILIIYLTLEKVMLTVLGALTGGYLAIITFSALNLISMDTYVLKFFVFAGGGVIGVLLIKLVFDWAMKVLSALIGAYLVSSILAGQPIFQLVVLAILTIAGVAIHGNTLAKTKTVNYPEPYPETYPH